MKDDPIVEEVHRVREKMWDECGGDLDRLIESLRASEKEHPERIVIRTKLGKMQQTSDAATVK